MKLKLFLWVLIVVAQPLVAAVDDAIVWKRLIVWYGYTDPGLNTGGRGEAFFVLEIQNGKAIAARLVNELKRDGYFYRPIDFDKSELNRIKWTQGPTGEVWLKELVFSERLSKWLIHFSTNTVFTRHFENTLPLPSSVAPSSQTFAFNLDGIEKGAEICFSNEAPYSGLNGKQEPFKAEFQLVQMVLRDLR